MRVVVRRPSRSRHLPAGALAAALLLGAGTVACRQGTAAALPDGCPKIVPVGQVTTGTRVTGLTTASGTAPEPFTGEVLGTVADGIAPGVPMILVRLSSPAIDRAGGVWAGMSGSPVYAGDGGLIGAVAYGLATGPSKIAGVTPAETVAELLDGERLASEPRQAPAGRPAPSAPGAVPGATPGAVGGPAGGLARGATATRLAGVRPGVPGRQAAGGLKQLPLPLGLSGFTSARFERIRSSVARSSRFHALAFQAAAAPPRPGGTGTPVTAPPAGAGIVPGGNFAVALAHGDVTAAGIGTVTLACQGAVVAFGHPFLFSGGTALSAHTAETVAIHDDPAHGPFKIANPGPVVGTVTADRLAGVRAQLGTGPRTTVLTSTVTSADRGRTRNGRTEVNLGEFVPTIAAGHLLSNLDRVFDQIGRGRSTVTWTATGTFGGGRPWRLTRTNSFSSRTDVGLDSIGELLGFLMAIADNDVETVRFDSVTMTARVTEHAAEQRLSRLERRDAKGRFQRVGPGSALRAQPGEAIVLRAWLDSYKSLSPPQPVELTLEVPPGAAGKQGTLTVAGGLIPSDGVDDCLFDPALCPIGVTGVPAEDLVHLLASQPRNDDVIATLRFDASEAPGQLARGNQGAPRVPGAGSLGARGPAAGSPGAGPLTVTASARARDVVRGAPLQFSVVVAARSTGARARKTPVTPPPRRPLPAPAQVRAW